MIHLYHFCSYSSSRYSGLPLSRRKKKSLTFLHEIAGNMSNKCTCINPNYPWTSRIKMNYSTNKVQASYFVELPQSNFPDYTNSPTFHWLWAFFLALSGFQKFQKSGNPGYYKQHENLHTKNNSHQQAVHNTVTGSNGQYLQIKLVTPN